MPGIAWPITESQGYDYLVGQPRISNHMPDTNTAVLMRTNSVQRSLLSIDFIFLPHRTFRVQASPISHHIFVWFSYKKPQFDMNFFFFLTTNNVYDCYLCDSLYLYDLEVKQTIFHFFQYYPHKIISWYHSILPRNFTIIIRMRSKYISLCWCLGVCYFSLDKQWDGVLSAHLGSHTEIEGTLSPLQWLQSYSGGCWGLN